MRWPRQYRLRRSHHHEAEADSKSAARRARTRVSDAENNHRDCNPESRESRRVNQELSVFHLVMNASVTVQLVMTILLLASVASWFFIVQRVLYFREARQEMETSEQEFWSGIDLSQLFRQGNSKVDGNHIVGMESIFRSGFKEFSRLRQQVQDGPDAVMEGSRRARRVAMSREQEKMSAHLPFLATVGSTSPYVGLFGTVWGIMTSFQGLATV